MKQNRPQQPPEPATRGAIERLDFVHPVDSRLSLTDTRATVTDRGLALEGGDFIPWSNVRRVRWAP